MFNSVSNFGIADVWDLPLCNFSFGGLDGDFSCADCGIADEAFCGGFCEEFCEKLYPNYLCNFCLNE